MLNTEVNTDVEHLRKDIAALRADVASLTKSLKHLAADRGRETIDRIEELSDRAKGKADEVVHSTERKIGENPFASVATSFGLGFVLGVLLDRKR